MSKSLQFHTTNPIPYPNAKLTSLASSKQLSIRNRGEIRVHPLLLTKKSRTFQTPKMLFRDSVITQQRYITDKQQLLALYGIYSAHDSIIHHKTFITSCKETVRLAQSRNTSYNIYLHMVFYT